MKDVMVLIRPHLPAEKAMHRAITSLVPLCHPLNEYSSEQDQLRDQAFSSTKTQTAGLKELSYVALNISDIQVIVKY